MVGLPGMDRKTIVERVKAIILTPNEEWVKIAGENRDQPSVLTGYVLPLAAIGPLATFIGGQLFGDRASLSNQRPPIARALVEEGSEFVLAAAGVLILAQIVHMLTPRFGGSCTRGDAFRFVAYGATAAWLAQLFNLVPTLKFFSVLGLYSFYLFYAGARPLLKVPDRSTLAFAAVVSLCALALMLVIPPMGRDVADLLGKRTETAGVSQIDLGRAGITGRDREDTAAPIEAARLQKLLPETIGDFVRTGSHALALGALGSTAEATYASGEHYFALRIADVRGAQAFTGVDEPAGTEQSREGADSYERTTTVDGQIQHEAWNAATGSGKFGQMVAGRFMVEAEGSVDAVDRLKAAVASVDREDLTDLAE